MGEAPLTITLSDPLAKCLFPVSIILCSPGLEVLVPELGMFSSGDTTIFTLNWKLRLPPGYFGLLSESTLNQQAKKRVIMLAECLILIIKGKLDYCPKMEVRKNKSGTQEILYSIF